MSAIRSFSYPTLFLVALLLACGGVLVNVAGIDVISSFEDDSVNYLILAQWMSPWFEPTAIIADAAAQEKFPPLFPALLALTGGSHHLLIAHLLVVFLHLAAIAGVFLFARRVLGADWLALVAAALLAISPSLWLNILGILSEGLYLVLSLALFYYVETRARDSAHWTGQRAVVLAALLTALVLTRYFGVAAVAALAMTALVAGRSLRCLFRPGTLALVLVPLGSALAWSFLRGTPEGGGYTAEFAGNLGSFSLATQAAGIFQFWIRALVLFWSDSNIAQFLGATGFGVLALAGACRRLVLNRADGWYVLCYGLILLLWPYHAQMGRFLHAVLPFLVVHALVGAQWLVSALPQAARARIPAAIGLVMLGLMLPTLAFFAGRAGYPTRAPGMDFSRVSIFYAEVDQGAAEFRALRNELMRFDMDRIRESTPADAVIAWFTPSYIRLLSDRHAVELPVLDAGDLRTRLAASGVTHVYLSSLHPRQTRRVIDVDALRQHFDGFAESAWEVTFPGSDITASTLLRVMP